MEEAGSSPRPETPSTLTETEGEMEGSPLEVDLDSYQTTLEEVLTWLLSAEDALHIQDEVSDDVEEVKEQFHTHEVGGDLQLGLRLAQVETCMHKKTEVQTTVLSVYLCLLIPHSSVSLFLNEYIPYE